MEYRVAAYYPLVGRASSARSWPAQGRVQLLIIVVLLLGTYPPISAPATAQASAPINSAAIVDAAGFSAGKLGLAAPGQPATSHAALVLANAETEPTMPEALSEALKFNIFILGDLTQRRSVIYGRVAVGGNASLERCRIGDGMPRSRENRADLIVGGTLVFTNGTVAKGGIVAGSATLTDVGIPHGQLGEAPMIDFASHGPALTQLSSRLGQLSPTGSTEIRQRRNLKKQIVLTGSDQRLNIFALASQDLATTQTLIISVPPKSSVLININGPTGRLQNLGFAIGNTSRQQILYNFYEATELTLNDDRIQGSILAPRATVTLVAGRVNGTLIGAALTGGGVTWPAPFLGPLPTL
jgi:choice-of-anchor A domain-containing protein